MVGLTLQEQPKPEPELITWEEELFNEHFKGYPELKQHIEDEGSCESLWYVECAKKIQKWWRKKNIKKDTN